MTKPRKEYHMALKKLLKSILNVNCIQIKKEEFNQFSSSLHIHVEPTKGQRYCCPICGRKCRGYDSTTERRAWRALDLGLIQICIIKSNYFMSLDDFHPHLVQMLQKDFEFPCHSSMQKYLFQ